MSANPDGGDYYDKSKTKDIIDFSQEGTKYDDVLDQFGEDSNRYVGDLMFKYHVDSDAMTTKDLASAQNVANFRTAKLMKLRQADYEGVREFKACQKEAETAWISRLTSDETNTKTVTVAQSTSYRTLPIKNR